MAGDPGVPHDQGVKEARERVAIRRSLDREDTADHAVMQDALLTEYGVADFHTGREMLEHYIVGLEPEERAAILSGTTKEGVQFLNDPATVKVLVKRAMGGLPTRPSEIERELSELKELMADRNSRYWRGAEAPRLQLRYRWLVNARGRR